MVFSASDAQTLTTNAATRDSDSDFQTEVSLTESRIRSYSAFGFYSLLYNATIIGNPAVDPRNTSSLPLIQQQFYNLFVDAGYLVSLDPQTGYWLITWDTQGAENLVAIYSFRTSLDPTAILTPTREAISGFFGAIRPVVFVSVTYNGSIDETVFGVPALAFYEFTVVANQNIDATNYAPTLKAALVSQGIGYTSDNCNVYQLT